MAWCPWQSRLLATGGGTSDRTVRIWNMNTGECSYTIDTKSQVSGIFWNTEYSEIITSHGFPNHTLQIWKYPTMNKVAELTGHEARILHLAMSPGETAVMSAGADETLRLWNCFQPDPSKKKGPTGRKNEPRSALDALSNFRWRTTHNPHVWVFKYLFHFLRIWLGQKYEHFFLSSWR